MATARKPAASTRVEVRIQLVSTLPAGLEIDDAYGRELIISGSLNGLEAWLEATLKSVRASKAEVAA